MPEAHDLTPRPGFRQATIAAVSGAALVLLIGVAACSPLPASDGSRQASAWAAFPPEQRPPPALAAVAAEHPRLGERRAELRGDEGFRAGDLSGEARRWFDETWESIRLPEQREYFGALASSDNLYEYSRLVNTYLVSLLTALRATGDLGFLDEADRLAQLMRAELHDSWRRPAERSGGRDGYLNWAWRNRTSEFHRGKDLHETDEMGTHALVAELAWAYQANRGLAGPAGIDYGERADFWLDYLRNHFEAKWRERNQVRWPRFPFLSRPHMHETVSFIKYHYYLYRLTGEEPYLREARRLSDTVFAEFRQVETPVGAAFAWPRSVTAMGGSEQYLMPTTYSSLVIADALDLFWEGFYGWADESVPTRFANTLSQFVIDNGPNDFARDIGGGEDRAGLAATRASDWRRLEATQFAIGPFALLSAWDRTGEIGEVAAAIHRANGPRHRYVHIPVGLLVDALLRDDAPAAGSAD